MHSFLGGNENMKQISVQALSVQTGKLPDSNFFHPLLTFGFFLLSKRLVWRILNHYTYFTAVAKGLKLYLGQRTNFKD